MASSATFSFFLLLTLLASLHVDARDSQFFSKVTSNNIPKEVKEQEHLNKPEEEPNFVPQNQQNLGGYGLYGHESGLLPPSTTTTENLPYNKESNPNLVDGLYYNNDANVNRESYSTSNNGDQYHNNDAYVLNQQGMSDTRLMDNAYVTKPQDMSNTRLMDNAYTTPLTSNNNDAYVTKPQGMSDARLMDNAYTTPITSNNNDAYVAKPQGMSNARFMDKAYTIPITSNNNGDQYYNNEAYVTKPQGMSNTRLMDNAYTNNKYNGENMYNNREHGIGEAKLGVTNGNNMYDNEKHGMSDTRVMENGRYYYDLDTEKNYNLNNYNNENSRAFNSRNEYYNSRGNYGNSFKAQNGNNENFMQGYNGNQEEFQESQDEQWMP